MKIKYISEIKLENAYAGDCGYDVYIPRKITIKRGQTVKIKTSIKLDLGLSIFGVLHNRSSYSSKGLYISNSPVDGGYTGYIHCIMTYFGPKRKIVLTPQVAVAQLVFYPNLDVKLNRVVKITRKTARGLKAFGSSNEKTT